MPAVLARVLSIEGLAVDAERDPIQALWLTADWGLDIEITEGALHEDSASEVDMLMALVQLGRQQSQGYPHSAAVSAGKFARMLAQGDEPILLSPVSTPSASPAP